MQDAEPGVSPDAAAPRVPPVPPVPPVGAVTGVAATTVPIGDITLAALEAGPVLPEGGGGAGGSGERGSILLVPGYTGSKEDFLPLLPLLAAAGHRTLAVDQRGQYESPGFGDVGAYSLAGLGSDAAAAARATSVGGRGVHLVGHSFGGLVAQAAVVAAPEVFASVTLMCTGSGRHPMADLAWMLDPLRDGDLDAVWRGMRERDREPPDPPRLALLHRRLLATDPAQLLAAHRMLSTAPDRVDAMAATGVPALVVRGEDDDAWPHEEQAAMAERLGARYAVIPDAGHSPALDQPRRLAAVLLDFFDEAEASVGTARTG